MREDRKSVALPRSHQRACARVSRLRAFNAAE
jgi:hypothetical protein